MNVDLKPPVNDDINDPEIAPKPNPWYITP